jgi:hypothetical protein
MGLTSIWFCHFMKVLGQPAQKIPLPRHSEHTSPVA